MDDLDRYRDRLRRVARRIVDEAEADDVVQETLLRALVSPPPDLDTPLLPWLTVVARRLAIDVVRRQGRLEPSAVDDAADPGDPPATSDLAAVLPGLGVLSRGELAVLLLRDALELDVASTARALDTTPGTVRVTHHRARAKAAAGSDPAAGLEALDRFCTWLLARHVAGLPVGGGVAAGDPALTEGVLRAHRSLLDSLVDVARRSGHAGLLRRALASRGVARAVVHDPGARDDLLAAAAGDDGSLDAVGTHLVRASIDEGLASDARGWLDRSLVVCTRPARRRILHALGLQLALDAGDSAAAARHQEGLQDDVIDTPGARAMRWVGEGFRALAEERWTDARGAWFSAWGLAREFGNPPNELTLLNNLFLACLSEGRLDEAEEHLAVARALVTRSRIPAERVLELDGNEATLVLLRGDRAGAEVRFERLLAAFGQTGQALHAALARYHLGVLAHLAGDPGRAHQLLDTAVQHLAGAEGLGLAVEVHREAVRWSLGRSEVGAFDQLEARCRQSRRPSTAHAAALFAAASNGRTLADLAGEVAPVVSFARWICTTWRARC